jgi:hypothetical protein
MARMGDRGLGASPPGDGSTGLSLASVQLCPALRSQVIPQPLTLLVTLMPVRVCRSCTGQHGRVTQRRLCFTGLV